MTDKQKFLSAVTVICDTAPLLLSIFYSYYHNFKRLCAPQKKGGERP